MKRARKVFRIESTDGVGLYKSGLAEKIKRIGVNLYDFYAHPSPNRDKPLRVDDYDSVSPWHFGFASIAQMQMWIETEDARDWLNRHNARMVVYRVTDYRIGHTQMMFKRATATVLRSELLPVPAVCDLGPLDALRRDRTFAASRNYDWNF